MARKRKIVPLEQSDDEIADKDGKLSKPGVAESRPVPVETPQARDYVQLGPERKLTKAQKSSLGKWTSEHRGRELDSFIAAHMAAKRVKFPHSSIFHGLHTGNLCVCIPVPALSFEFLVCNDGWPLGLVFQLNGLPGVGKSGLLAEFNRWFDLAGGFSTLKEHESKFSDMWWRSIMGDTAYNRMNIDFCKSLEEWQRLLTFDVQRLSLSMDGTAKNPGPGRRFPINFGVDAILSKSGEKSQQKVLEDGAGSGGYPRDAKTMADYLRTLPQLLDGYPFSVVLNNHLRVRKDDDGYDQRITSGGEQLKFQQTIELEVRRVGPQRFECTDFMGYTVEIVCQKNSLGDSFRRIRVRVLWWDEPDGEGGWRQKTVWDWDWSMIHLLFSIIKGGEKEVFLRRHLKDIGFHMEFSSPTALGAMAWSDTLGISKDDALSWSEMGQKLRNTPEVLQQLRQALLISKRPYLKGDYLEQLTQIAEEQTP